MIVSPKNAFSAWEEQLCECTENNPGFEIYRFEKESLEDMKKNKAYILTYQSLINPSNSMKIFNWLKTEGEHFIILDESHRIKGIGNKGTKSALNISHLSERRIIMSGTPMPQSVDDLIPQLEFLYQNQSVRNSEQVQELMKKVFVRTRKRELDLPEPNITTIELDLSEEQLQIKEIIKQSDLLGIDNRNKVQKLKSLRRNAMKLLQFTSNPKLLINEHIEDIEPLNSMLKELTISQIPKIYYTLNKTRELVNKGERVVIWSIFKKNIHYIQENLKDLGADFIHGDVSTGREDEPGTRENKIRKFKQGDLKVLVANPASCSEGISLHKHCHNAIYVDRSFNLAHYLQSMDRIHRVGLDKNVETNIEILCVRETIDIDVHGRLKLKKEKMDKFLDKKDISVSNYEERDEEEYEKRIEKSSDLNDFDEEDAKSVEERIKKELEE